MDFCRLSTVVPAAKSCSYFSDEGSVCDVRGLQTPMQGDSWSHSAYHHEWVSSMQPMALKHPAPINHWPSWLTLIGVARDVIGLLLLVGAHRQTLAGTAGPRGTQYHLVSVPYAEESRH